MTTAYIAHFYPDIDAPTHFQVGSVIQVLAPVFGSYSEAARQLAEDIDDIDEAELPVSAYIIEAEPVAGGYEILDVYAVVDDRPKKTRTRNAGIPPAAGPNDPPARAPRGAPKAEPEPKPEPKLEPKAEAEAEAELSPNMSYSKLERIGETVEASKIPENIRLAFGRARLAKINQPEDIKTSREAYIKVPDAAKQYGNFMAAKAPKGVSPRLITGEFNKQFRGAVASQYLRDLAEARKEGRQGLWEIIKADVKKSKGNAAILTDAMIEADNEIRILRDEQNALDPKKDAQAYKEKAQQISRQNKRYEILGYLAAYCPLCAGHEAENTQLEAMRGENLRKLKEKLRLPTDFNPESPDLRSKQQAMLDKQDNKGKSKPKTGTVTDKSVTPTDRTVSSVPPVPPTQAMAEGVAGAPPGVRAGFIDLDSQYSPIAELREDVLEAVIKFAAAAKAQGNYDLKLSTSKDALDSIDASYSTYVILGTQVSALCADLLNVHDTLRVTQKPSSPTWRTEATSFIAELTGFTRLLPFDEGTLADAAGLSSESVATPTARKPAKKAAPAASSDIDSEVKAAMGKVVSRPPESNNEPAPETTEYGFGGGYDDTFDGID